MTAMSEGFKRPTSPRGGPKTLLVRGGTAGSILAGSLVAHRDRSQLAEAPDPLAPRGDLIYVGVAEHDVSWGSAVGASGQATYTDEDGVAQDVVVITSSGIVIELDNGTGPDEITMEDLGRPVYGYDNNTVYKTNRNSLLSPVGMLHRVTPGGRVEVVIDDAPVDWALFGQPRNAFGVRCVITSLGAYTASGGVITVTATGALAAQDGIAVDPGDEVWLPEYTGSANGGVSVSAANSGPYRIINAGGVGVQAVLRRPAWWPHGGTMPLGADIGVAEGTMYGRTRWDSGAPKGSIVGTNDPAAFPDSVTQSVVLVASEKIITNVPIRTGGKTNASAALAGTGGTTTGTIGYGTIVPMTPGPIGTASATIVAIASGGTKNGVSDTSTVIVTIF